MNKGKHILSHEDEMFLIGEYLPGHPDEICSGECSEQAFEARKVMAGRVVRFEYMTALEVLDRLAREFGADTVRDAIGVIQPATEDQMIEAVKRAGLSGRLVKGRIPPGAFVTVSGYDPGPFKATVLGATSPAGHHYAVLRQDGRVLMGVHSGSIREETSDD